MGHPDRVSVQELRRGLGRALPEIPVRCVDAEVVAARVPSAEEGILHAHAGTVTGLVAAGELVGMARDAHRARPLLDALCRQRGHAGCTLFDPDPVALSAAVAPLASAFPRLTARGVVGDLARDLWRLGAGGGRLLVLLAGAFGSLRPADVAPLLSRTSGSMQGDDCLLVGVDLVSDHLLEDGNAAAANHRVIRVLNDGWGADFEADGFEHRALYDARSASVELRLRATRSMRVNIPAAQLVLQLDAGQEIRTGRSCRYTRQSLRQRAEGTRLAMFGWFADAEETSALALFRRT